MRVSSIEVEGYVLDPPWFAKAQIYSRFLRHILTSARKLSTSELRSKVVSPGLVELVQRHPPLPGSLPF
jgi:hypothetical protein